MSHQGYVPGAWNADCALCGRSFKSFELRKHWQGQWRCRDCWETRHPQEFVRSAPREQPPPWTQELGHEALGAVCFPNGTTSIAGFSTSGCWIAGYTHPFFDPTVTGY